MGRISDYFVRIRYYFTYVFQNLRTGTVWSLRTYEVRVKPFFNLYYYLPSMESEAPYSVQPAQPESTPAPRGCARLAQSIATNERSINLGGSILSMLGNQREALLSTRETLNASQEHTRRSLGITLAMIQRVRGTNCFKLGVIVLLCAQPRTAPHKVARRIWLHL